MPRFASVGRAGATLPALNEANVLKKKKPLKPKNRPPPIVLLTDPFTSPMRSGAVPVGIYSNATNIQFNECRVDGREIESTTIENRVNDSTIARVATTPSATVVGGFEYRKRSTTDDEERAARSLAAAWNLKNGTAYEGHVEPDKAKYEDAYLRSSRSDEVEIPLQIRHFHDELTTRFKTGQLSRFELNRLPLHLQRAIDAKAIVDRGAVAATVLVLVSPVPLGPMTRARIRSVSLDGRGFRALWLCAFGESAFELNSN